MKMIQKTYPRIDARLWKARQKMIAHSLKMEGTKNRPKRMKYFDGISAMACNPNNFRTLIGATATDKLVGTFCTFVPEELIIAAGAKPVRLDVGLSSTVDLGEQVLPRIVCPALKSIIGFFTLFGDRPDLLIMPTVCDGKKKLCDILKDYAPTWILGVPHTTRSQQAKNFWRREVQSLREKLEEFTGKKITGESLREAIELYNRRRRALRRLYETRKASRPPIWGRDVLEVVTTMFCDNPKRWTYQVEKLCEGLEGQVKKGVGVCDEKTPRIMLAGSPILPPNWKIPDMVEETGGVIVADELCSGTRGYWYLVETAEEARGSLVKALANRYFMCECACFTPNYDRIDRIVKVVKDWNVDAVVYHSLIACHTFSIEASSVEAALRKIGVPVLKIETDYAAEDVEQVRTRVEAFLEMIR